MTALERNLFRRLARLRALLARLEQQPGFPQERELSDQIWATIAEVRSARAALDQRRRHEGPQSRIH